MSLIRRDPLINDEKQRVCVCVCGESETEGVFRVGEGITSSIIKALNLKT